MQNSTKKLKKSEIQLFNRENVLATIFDEKIEIRERCIFPNFRQWIPKRCKGVHCIDLGESFPTHILLQNLASIQPRTSLVKYARSPRTDPPGAFGNSDRSALRRCLNMSFLIPKSFFSRLGRPCTERCPTRRSARSPSRSAVFSGRETIPNLGS